MKKNVAAVNYILIGRTPGGQNISRTVVGKIAAKMIANKLRHEGYDIKVMRPVNQPKSKALTNINYHPTSYHQ